MPYLKALGISHLYVSPILTARKGSRHGYDIVDHNQLNPELGGAAGFETLSAALRAADIGLLVDIVPNHMGVGYADNAWWLDVLEWGPRSPHAASFDIEWTTLPFRASSGVLLPILGASYGTALEQGDLKLRFDAAEGSFSIWYFDHRLPVRPDRYADILATVVAAAKAEREPAGRTLLDLAEHHRAPGTPTREAAPALKAALAAVAGGAAVIERGLAAYRPTAGHPARTQRLHRLLERQHYRVANWRMAFTDINYRRFFDINDLAGLRTEDPTTFADTHRLIARLIAEGHIHGLRLDHIDGLADPVQYARRLGRLVRSAHAGRSRAPFYIVAEKILAEDEAMPPLPGVAGTTGYDALDLIQRALVNGEGFATLDTLHRAMTANAAPFPDMAREAKALVLDSILASEFVVLVHLLARIAAGHWKTRDFTFERLKAALRAVIVRFPVYRTYIAGAVSAADRACILNAIEEARASWFGPDAEIFDVLRGVLTLDIVAAGRSGYSRARVRHFVTKLQQLTGPVMAKAVEDTAFYRHHRLLALNEVGSGPDRPALPAPAFHDAVKARATYPHAMTATATHDTKRGEDARMRILALADIAGDWAVAVRHWRSLNARLVEPGVGPTPAHEYMLYQALIGAWPADGAPDGTFLDRMQTYAVKALREGKAESSWAMPNARYEAATAAFLAGMLDPAQSAAFLDRFAAFAARTARLGALNSLAQLALKATLPGVPDFYQGTETWDLSLVDPDNRRPVEFGQLADLLQAMPGGPPAAPSADPRLDRRTKFVATRQLLAWRAERAAIYTSGAYQPLAVSGPDAGHLIAFARTLRRAADIVVVARHLAAFTDGGRLWPDFKQLKATIHCEGLLPQRVVLGGTVTAPRDAIAANALLGPLPFAVVTALRVGEAASEPAPPLALPA